MKNICRKWDLKYFKGNSNTNIGELTLTTLKAYKNFSKSQLFNAYLYKFYFDEMIQIKYVKMSN